MVHYPKQNNQIIHTDVGKFFFINGSIIDSALITSPNYFTINYSPILDFIPQMQKEFELNIRCLLKLASENKVYSGSKHGEFLAMRYCQVWCMRGLGGML